MVVAMCGEGEDAVARYECGNFLAWFVSNLLVDTVFIIDVRIFALRFDCLPRSRAHLNCRSFPAAADRDQFPYGLHHRGAFRG